MKTPSLCKKCKYVLTFNYKYGTIYKCRQFKGKSCKDVIERCNSVNGFEEVEDGKQSSDDL